MEGVNPSIGIFGNTDTTVSKGGTELQLNKYHSTCQAVLFENRKLNNEDDPTGQKRYTNKIIQRPSMYENSIRMRIEGKPMQHCSSISDSSSTLQASFDLMPSMAPAQTSCNHRKER